MNGLLFAHHWGWGAYFGRRTNIPIMAETFSRSGPPIIIALNRYAVGARGLGSSMDAMKSSLLSAVCSMSAVHRIATG